MKKTEIFIFISRLFGFFFIVKALFQLPNVLRYSQDLFLHRLIFGLYIIIALILIVGTRYTSKFFVKEEQTAIIDINKRDILSMILIYFGLSIIVSLIAWIPSLNALLNRPTLSIPFFVQLITGLWFITRSEVVANWILPANSTSQKDTKHSLRSFFAKVKRVLFYTLKHTLIWLAGIVFTIFALTYTKLVQTNPQMTTTFLTWIIQMTFILSILGNMFYAFGEIFVKVILKSNQQEGYPIVGRVLIRIFGLFLALALLAMIEIVIFNKKFCFGLTCALNIKHSINSKKLD